MNSEQAAYILKYLQHKKIRNYFRFCFVSEELSIPTIIFNLPFACYTTVFPRNNYEGLSTLAAMHLFEYGKCIKIYQEDDFDFFVQSDKMFVRKLVTGISDTLMDRIDERRNL